MNAARIFLSHKVIYLVVGLLALVAAGFGPDLVRASSFMQSSPMQSAPMHMSSVTSNASGLWSDPHIWSSGAVPQAGDAVVIRAGDTVTYDLVSDTVLDQVTINGELYFSRQVNTRLKVNNHILVQAGGYLNMGTSTDYLPATIKAELTFVLTGAQANAFVGSSKEQNNLSHGHDGATHFQSSDIGLWVFDKGRWDVHGAPLLRTWSKLVGDVGGGSQTVVVENNVGDWYGGGQVVVTSTRNPDKYYTRPSDGREITKIYDENEVRNIQTLEDLGNGQTRITLDRPLAFSHSGTAPMRGEVALLTRNVLLSTELVGQSSFTDVRSRKFAHTMYMAGSQGNLEYAEFKRLGHYGSLGRYAIHYHRTLETSEGMIVRGNSIWETGFRCINLHIAHGVLVEDNVCYDSSSSAYFVEADGPGGSGSQADQRGYNEDNVFVHNIAIATNPKSFDDRNRASYVGEARRMAAYWPGSETQNEAYLGNVAVGGREYGESAGFGFPENGNNIGSKGEIPFTFVSNEVHSSANYGIFSWQNVSVQRDMVNTLLWRNGDAGIRWGAYNMPAFYFNTQLLENGRSGLEVTSVNAFIQDSTIIGSLTDGSKDDMGFAITGYIVPQYPNPGAWIVRDVFQNLQTSGVSQLQQTLSNDNVNGNECEVHDYEPNPPYDVKVRPVWPGECSAVYITLMGNKFENVAHPLVFGRAANPNSWWKVFDFASSQTAYDDFVLVRSDQTQKAKQGVLTQKLVTAQAVQSPDFKALVVPMASLPQAGVQFGGLRNHRESDKQDRSRSADFVFKTQPDYPPTVSLDVSVNGKSVTLKASAADDKGVSRIEFFVDWTMVAAPTLPAGTLSTAQEVTVDLSNHPRRYAYLYVRAFDGTRQFGNYEQRAYSQVIELGPEILGTAEQVAGPQQPSGPVEVATPEDIPERLYLPLLGDE